MARAPQEILPRRDPSWPQHYFFLGLQNEVMLGLSWDPIKSVSGLRKGKIRGSFWGWFLELKIGWFLDLKIGWFLGIKIGWFLDLKMGWFWDLKMRWFWTSKWWVFGPQNGVVLGFKMRAISSSS